MGGYNFFNPVDFGVDLNSAGSTFDPGPVPSTTFDYSSLFDAPSIDLSGGSGLGDEQQQEPDYWSSSNLATPALDRYMDIVQHTPDINDYQPSIWRRIAAGAVGGLTGHPENIEGMVYGKYRNALQNYRTQESGARSAAQLEGSNLGRKNTFFNTMRQRQQQDRTYELNLEQLDALKAHRDRQDRTAEDRARTAKWYQEQTLAIRNRGLDQGQQRINQGQEALGYNRRRTDVAEANSRFLTSGPHTAPRQLTPSQKVTQENYAMENVVRQYPEFENLVHRNTNNNRVDGTSFDQAVNPADTKRFLDLVRQHISQGGVPGPFDIGLDDLSNYGGDSAFDPSNFLQQDDTSDSEYDGYDASDF